MIVALCKDLIVSKELLTVVDDVDLSTICRILVELWANRTETHKLPLEVNGINDDWGHPGLVC